MPYSIMVDAGHGGKDPGAVYDGRQEKDDALRLALAVGEILQNNDIDVEYTRTTDVYETPYQKAMEANNAGVDLFISIHRNSFPEDNEAEGVESLVYDLSGLKYQIAQAVNEQLEAVGFVNLGVKARPNLVVLKRTQMPAVLIEAGFINSDSDNELFDANFEAIAQAIAFGILDTLEREGVIRDPGMANSISNGMTNGMAMRNGAGMSGRTQPRQMYRVQVGAFRNRNYAIRLRDELLEQDFPAYLNDSGEFIRVGVGDFDTLGNAVEMERRLKRDGYQTVLITR
ncbi:N-acetylmuramoyl-L-alanine amidase [Sporofaciens sp. SGI.106]|uniref:N-acetylmuramoyl-L-alanine amidase n=1 Tax=Sporofaciens sp. SGI.106 TaxID=3420568 RepID=UPI002A92D936|nr:N-acetylmuramoyl-L-alanine amidase [Lachnoclostridium sp.]